MIVRPLQSEDLGQSSTIHLEVLRTEFLTRAGRRFLRRYHRAWIESDDAIALAAVDTEDRVVGVLLGSTRPALHYRAMVRRHGLQLSLLLLLQALTHRSFARELLITRGRRYARGVLRMSVSVAKDLVRKSRNRNRSGADVWAVEREPQRVGEITHVMVTEELAGSGIGRALLDAAEDTAVQAKLDELVLVTMPGLSAAAFYEHLGWERVGDRRSRSGEDFVQYRLFVATRP